jgi:hypothetical protein
VIPQTRPKRPLKRRPYPFLLRAGEVQEVMDAKQWETDVSVYNYDQVRPRPLRMWISEGSDYGGPRLLICMQCGPGKKPLRPADKILFDTLMLIPGARQHTTDKQSPLVSLPLTVEAFRMIPQQEL